MDTAAQHMESDRSLCPSDPEDPTSREAQGPQERSHSVFPVTPTQWVPGGRITLGVLLFLVFSLLIGRFVVQPFEIPSGSMEPGLSIGDRVLVNKVAYRFGSGPRRGDVVVFDGTGYYGDADYIKRVVGVGGDHVVCCDSQGSVEVNGRSVEETYLHSGDAPSKVSFHVVVPDGRLFLLGDHRSRSSDSRDHLGSPGGGMVPVDAVIGRVDWIGWPIDHWASLDRPDTFARVPDAHGAPARVPASDVPARVPAASGGAHG